ncbi:MAG: esterase-like activity of phytase family protein [Kiritimatiellae bacterium]|nr:esterase-like activity of phytase family protein [Kiritimatiellia bacterium]
MKGRGVRSPRLGVAAAVALAACGAAAGAACGGETADSPWCGLSPVPAREKPGETPARATLSPIGEFALDADSAPEGLSGVSWLGRSDAFAADLFAFAEDSGGRVHFADVFFDAAIGAATGAAFRAVSTVPGAVDLEGVAFDSAACALWLSDEQGPALFRAAVSPGGTGGAPVLGAPSDERRLIPPALRRSRPNRSLEALCFDDASGILWTASESAVEGDAPGIARIAAIDPATGASREYTLALEEAPGAYMPSLPQPFTGLCALAALPGGRLLALERSFGYEIVAAEDGSAKQSLCRMTLSLVETEGAPPGGALRKTVLFRALSGDANYEGICLGPTLRDGARAVIAVADGDVSRHGALEFRWRKSVAVFRLDGI